MDNVNTDQTLELTNVVSIRKKMTTTEVTTSMNDLMKIITDNGAKINKLVMTTTYSVKK